MDGFVNYLYAWIHQQWSGGKQKQFEQAEKAWGIVIELIEEVSS